MTAGATFKKLFQEETTTTTLPAWYLNRKSVLTTVVPDSKIFLLGEAPGENEEKEGLPFVGYSGLELNRMLAEVGIGRGTCSLGNVFTRRPKENNLKEFTVPKREGSKRFPTPLQPSAYLHPYLEFELDRIATEIKDVRPNVVCAMGNTALWALTGHTKIKKVRGTLLRSTLVPGLKVMPTYHPAAVLREWSLRTIVLSDFRKVLREAEYPELRLPYRQVHIAENLDDLQTLLEYAKASRRIAVDLETAKRQITCIGFGYSPESCGVIPFVSHSTPDGSYWRSHMEEVQAWRTVQEILALPNIKVFQNGLYDIQWLMYLGLRINGIIEDTMILHHALFSELPKGLDFIGSTQTTEQAWKLFRARGDEATDKRDE